MVAFAKLACALAVAIAMSNTATDAKSPNSLRLREKKLAGLGFKKTGKTPAEQNVSLLVGYKLEFDEQELLKMSVPESSNFRKFRSFKESRSAAAVHVPQCSQALREWVKTTSPTVSVTPYSRYFGEYVLVQGTASALEQLLNVTLINYSQNSAEEVEIGTSESPLGNIPQHVKECVSLLTFMMPTEQPTEWLVPKRPKSATLDKRQCPSSNKIPSREAITPQVLSEMFSLPKSSMRARRNPTVRQAFFQDTSLSRVDTGDLSCFQSALGVPQTRISNIFGDARNATERCSSRLCMESNLDAQMMSALNPGQLDVVSGNILNAFALGAGHANLAAFVANTKDIPQVVSISYGNADKRVTPLDIYQEIADSNNHHFCTELGLSAMRGVTWFVASGDSGAGGEKTCSNTYLTTTYACPYITVVGATTGYRAGEEVVADASRNSKITSGGGFSSFYTSQRYDLSWQSDAVETYLAQIGNLTENRPAEGFETTGRAYPDISAPGTKYCTVNAGELSCSVCGTSASAPVMAAVTARVANELGGPLGWINPLLYRNQERFFDVVVGENSSGETSHGSCPGPEPGTIIGFPALPGWDAATGVGTISVDNGYDVYKSILAGI